MVTKSYVIPTLNQTCVAATNLQRTSAQVSASVTNDGGSVTASGFLYSTSSTNLLVTNTSTARVSATISVNNNIAVSLTGLTGSTLYYYRAYITGPAGTGYGPICSFTTPAITIVVPTVVTSPATNVVVGSAVINGSISSDGGGAIIDKGFEWSTGNSFNFTSPTVGYSTAPGTTFSRTLTTSSRGFVVYFRAFATNSAGTGYGVVRSFTFP